MPARGEDTDDLRRSLPDVSREAARRFGDRPFLLAIADEPAVSFAEFDALTDRLAAGLAQTLAPGEPVGLLVPTTNRAVIAVFALLKAAALPVLLPNQYRDGVLADVVRTMVQGPSGPSEREMQGPSGPSEREMQGPSGPSEREMQGPRIIAPRRWHHWLPPDVQTLDLAHLPAADDRPPWLRQPPSSDELAIVLPTSGTTGVAKGVLLPHGHGVQYAECTVAMRRMAAGDGVHAFTPLFHVDGIFGNVLAAMMVGARVALSWPVAISRFWDHCRARDLTTFAYAGGLLSMLLDQPPRPDDDANPVRVASGAPSPPDAARAFERRFGVHLTEGYGSTEAGIPLIAPWDDSRLEEGSCGRAVAGYDVRLLDDGELCVRPHDPSFVMRGYLGDPEATSVRLPGDGWLHTGDLLADIGDGHYAFRGRKEEIIRHRGEFVAPVLVEQAALTHPGVVEAAAYGAPRESGEPGEEEVVLAVVWADGARPDAAGLQAHLRGSLPPVAVPALVHVVDDLPRSPGTGKVQKLRLPGADAARAVTP